MTPGTVNCSRYFNGTIFTENCYQNKARFEIRFDFVSLKISLISSTKQRVKKIVAT